MSVYAVSECVWSVIGCVWRVWTPNQRECSVSARNHIEEFFENYYNLISRPLRMYRAGHTQRPLVINLYTQVTKNVRVNWGWCYAVWLVKLNTTALNITGRTHSVRTIYSYWVEEHTKREIKFEEATENTWAQWRRFRTNTFLRNTYWQREKHLLGHGSLK